MSSMIAIDRALLNKRMLGAGLGDSATWSTWITILRAAYGLPLDEQQRQRFATIAGDRSLPSQRVRELWVVAGRRSGKSRMSAAIAIHTALFVPHKLVRGERGMVLVIAGTVDQSRMVFDYVRGFLDAAPALAKEVVNTTRHEILLRNGIVIAVHSNSFRTVRGRTLVAAVFDEISFWRDESSATPDVEVYRAVLPSLATTNGVLVAISTAYRKAGLMYTKYRNHFGQDGNDVLVVRGGSKVFNPSLNDAVIQAQRDSDPVAALAEWDAEFRNDIGAFLDDQSIDAAVDHGRPLELPPHADTRYFCFVDMGGGRHDASTVAVVHYVEDEGEQRRYVADAVRGCHGDPQVATAEFVELAKQYHCSTIVGDNYGADWAANAFREAGCEYRRSKLVRSELYLEGLPLFTRGLVNIADHPQLVRELRLLERRTARSGRDSVDHGVGGSDDHANALFGALHLAASAAARPEVPIVMPFFYSQPRNFPGSSLGDGSGDWQSWLTRPGFWG
jgi:Phage Terminase